jgi:hypothetical protein
MSSNIYHPFQVVLNIQNDSLISFNVNSGKIFNFYNPLNYRDVLCDINKLPLPKLPYSLSSEDVVLESNKTISKTKFITDTSFPVKGGTQKIIIYLFASFLAPEKWVSGSSYIPFIDKSWIVCNFYGDLDENSSFTTLGQTKNPDVKNIKFEVFDINEFNLQTDSLYITNPDLFEEEINPNSSAVNLGPIAKLTKINNIWQISQFIKENYAFTDFFDSFFYEKCNTEKYDLNFREVIPKEPETERYESESYQNFLNKKAIFKFMAPPVKTHLRGHFKYTANTIGMTETKILEEQYKFPRDYNYIRLEELSEVSEERNGGY